MKQFILFLVLGLSCTSLAQSDDDIREKLKTLEKRLAEVEANSSLDYVHFGGMLTSTYDDIAVKENYPVPHDAQNLHYLRLRFSLNMTADLQPSIKVYSRLTTSKFFNRIRYEGTDSSRQSDFGAAYRYNDSQVYLEKAYVDYSPSERWIASVGRLPTVDGGPSHLWDYRARQGTYPFLNFNVPLDGFAFTYKLDHLLRDKQYLAIRALYTPLSNVNLGSPNDRYLSAPTEDTNNGVASGAEVNTLVNAGAVQADFAILDSPLASDVSVILQSTLLGESTGTSGVGTSNLRFQGQSSSLYLEMVGLGNSSFDLAATLSYNHLHTTGEYGPGLGLGSSGEESHLYSNALLLSARYRLGNAALGLEYLQSSRLIFHYATADEDLIQFYRSPGMGKHIYVVYKLTNFMSLRAGFRQKELSNYNPGVGPIQNSDREINNFYVRLRTDF